MIKTIISIALYVITLTAHTHAERIYIDDEEFSAKSTSDYFDVHLGANLWIETNTIYRDGTGMYAQIDAANLAAYEKKWKCPYCYNLYPVGKACDNKDCPSKYK